MRQPLVTVIIPAYNQGSYIAEAIESVLKQDYPQDRIEIIVVDDGSTDGTREICLGLGAEGKEHREKQIPTMPSALCPMRYICQPNQGQAWAIKRGIEVASGKYIFILNADDVYLEDKISRTVEVFENDREITHVIHPTIYWDMKKGYKREEILPKDIMGRKIPGQELALFFLRNNKFYGGGSNYAGRLDVWKDARIKKEMYMFIDEYLGLFSLSKGWGYCIGKALSLYRVHGQGYSEVDIRSKIKKNTRACMSIQGEIMSGDFMKQVKVLYGLKTMVSEIRLKEFSGEKNFPDVVAMWKYLFNNLKKIDISIIMIIKNYGLLQRSMPRVIVGLVRKIRG